MCLLLLLVAAAGCRSAVSAGRPVGASGVKPTPTPATVRTLTWSIWGSPWEVDTSRRVARLFEAENPGTRVEMVHVDWPAYFDWLRREWEAGRSPDVMFLNYVPMRAAEGHLLPVDPFIERDRYSLDDFYPALLEQFRYAGSYYGLPRDNDTKVIYYNKDAFDAAGLAYPRAGWTWEQLRAAAIKLSRPTRQYGFGFDSLHWWRVFLWQNWANIVDDPFNPTRITVNSAEAIEAVDFLAGLVNRDRVTPPPDQLNDAALTELFARGELAMMFGNHSKVPTFSENAALRWDVAPLPRGARAANVAGGAGYVIARRAPDPDLAWEFIKFLTGPKGQAIFAESGQITPARRSVREDNIFLRRSSYNARVFIDEVETGQPNLIFPRADAISATLDRALDPVWRGEESAATALNRVVPELERELKN